MKQVQEMNKTIIFVISCILLITNGCKSVDLTTANPGEEYQEAILEHKTSLIGVGVNINIPELEKSINKNFSGLIYEDANFKDDNLLMKVWKQKDITFSMEKNVIHANVPLKIWVKTGFKKDVLGINVEDYYEANGAINIQASIAFQISKNWKLVTNTIIDDHRWIEKPTIKVVGIPLPLTAIADLSIKAFKSKITSSIDDAIVQHVNLSQILDNLWAKIQDPIQVDKDFDIWLKLTPQNLYSTPIVAKNNMLVFNIGLSSIVESSMGKELTKPSKKTTLPEYKIGSNLQSQFGINSNIYLSYDKLTQIANQYIVGQEFKQAGKVVRIDSVKLYGKKDLLIIQVVVSGSVKGDIFCQGKLNYDNSNRKISISDFDFAINTKHVLVKSANWLLHKSFLKMIEPMLTIDMKPQVDEVLESCNTLLAHYPIQKGVILKGHLNTIWIDPIQVTKEGILLPGYIKGDLSVDIGGLF